MILETTASREIQTNKEAQNASTNACIQGAPRKVSRYQ